MIAPPIPSDEAQRLAAIERYQLGGVGREPAFDHVTRLAASLFGVPMALVSIVGSEMQCFRGACGIDKSGTSRDVAFCGFAILGDGVMVVEDATKDERFVDNPLVTGEPFIRFYAGAPLRVAGGHAVGTLCLIDTVPRTFSAEQQERLAGLAQTVVDLIELRVGSLAAAQEHERAEEERALLHLTVENVSEGVALVDSDLRMILWNDTFGEMFGYPREAIQTGLDAAGLMKVSAERGDLGPGDPDQIVAGFVASIRSSESRRIEITRKDGRVLDIWRKSIRGGRFILTARDVTIERQTARLKEELVSTVSHELRTPLTAISGSLGLLQGGAGGELPPKAEGLVKIARKNSLRLARLVDDLLDLDKLQSGQLEFHFARTNMAEFLKEAVEQNSPYAEKLGMSIAFAPPAEDIFCQVDAGRMLQVMSNLLSNAAKFSPEGGIVTVRLTEEGEHARISVIDQGPGISPEFRERLFNRFAQEDASSQRGQSGTGLGLAITKEIVERHGGAITLDEAVERGATFHVTLPLS
ncbi:MAG TPA: ATP-binding protein [Allosphingosinicella sp.]|uniref:GAF domain-containing sensor histidine kinase n=1 Tax=Allosphingosinicella sp. TaxID=2823234 RepID=UPI002ED99DBD